VAVDSDEHSHPTDSAMSIGMAEPVIPEGAMYIAADVKFMQGMIAHHGQAVVMAKMAASHGANEQLLRFTQKIDLSQRGEIELMQHWLYEAEQEVPDSSAHLHMVMPGMLTVEQMQELDSASGKNFDRLFLLYMIEHHEGALTMVEELQTTPLSMQDPLLSSFATDIDTDQRAEILRMHQMLNEMK
jgi:uncharacterized protein (DUF305 family)